MIKDKFSGKIDKLSTKLENMESAYTCFNKLDNNITIDEIAYAVKKLKHNKSSGLDSISNEMLKSGYNWLSEALCNIFNPALLIVITLNHGLQVISLLYIKVRMQTTLITIEGYLYQVPLGNYLIPF